MRISHSDVYADVLRRELMADDLAMGRALDDPDDSRVAAAAGDVTDTFIMGPPGGAVGSAGPHEEAIVDEKKARTAVRSR